MSFLPSKNDVIKQFLLSILLINERLTCKIMDELFKKDFGYINVNCDT